ncbi:MAG: type II toxin-antitoxin system death-on-curing family toxin [Planctomycetota bacterium]
MRYLGGDELVYLHARMIEESGGLPGTKDETLVQTIPTRIRMTQKGQEVFSDLFVKAGTLMTLIAANQPFHDGNKRTAVAAAAIFIAMNGQSLTASDHEIVDLCRAVERGSLDAAQVGGWLKSKSTPRA